MSIQDGCFAELCTGRPSSLQAKLPQTLGHQCLAIGEDTPGLQGIGSTIIGLLVMFRRLEKHELILEPFDYSVAISFQSGSGAHRSAEAAASVNAFLEKTYLTIGETLPHELLVDKIFDQNVRMVLKFTLGFNMHTPKVESPGHK